MLRYKAKIEDLEATLAQKGQVGIWLLALLQMQMIRSILPLDHPVHGPHPGHGLALHSDLSQTVSECSTVCFCPWCFSGQSVNPAIARMRLARETMPEEEEPCTNS